MSTVFSFIKHPMVNLLEQSSRLITGLDKAIALYFDTTTNSIQCKGISKNNLIEDYFIDDLTETKKLRQRKPEHKWMSADNLPFETIQINKREKTLFDETDNVILSLGFTNNIDKKTDLLFLYLNHNKGNFGLSNSNNSLSTSEKAIIGSMAYNSLKLIHKQQIKDSETLKQINSRFISLQKENETLKKEIISLKENYLGSIIEMCNNHLEKISSQYGVKFVLSHDAIEKLQNFYGNIDDLKIIITKSAEIAINLNFGHTDGQITLKAWDLDFDSNKESKNKQYSRINVNERDLKTLQLLDKLENAARSVLNKNQSLTGENVGNACPTPISAPAITDALKNHHKKVIKLMTNYPDKWQLIRNEFRPVKNILQNSNVG